MIKNIKRLHIGSHIIIDEMIANIIKKTKILFENKF
jgi:hypothetical protein